MNTTFERITNDLESLIKAVASSHKNPFFFFEEIFYIVTSLILILFLTSLGRKIFKIFSFSPSRSSANSAGHLEGVVIVEELLFSLGLGIVVWGTLVLILGMLGILYFRLVWGIVGILFFINLKEMVRVVRDVREVRVVREKGIEVKIFLSFVFLNLIGALTPEKGVDAIGYHLYFPKIYLQNQTMMLQARGSRLFSLFPHLASMIYLLPVSLNMPNVAQLFHFWLGVLTAVNIYLITTKLFKKNSFLPSLLFYSPLIIGSISRSAYSDFLVTFFLSLGILGGVRVLREDKREKIEWSSLAAVMFGGTLATKNQSLALIPVIFFGGLVVFKGSLRNRLFKLLKSLVISFSVPFLWYLRSYLVSGNPFYPMFVLNETRVPELSIKFINVIKVIRATVLIQPILILIILWFLFLRKEKKIVFSLVSSLVIFLYWLSLPESFHDNRYFLPYLLVIILIICPLIDKLRQNYWFKLGILGMLGMLFLPRLYTNSFYLPYIFGQEEKKVFLSNALKDRPEDFYDIDGKFSTIMEDLGDMRKIRRKVLTENILGLYYVDFPFEEYEYSPFYGKKFSKKEFVDLWERNNFSFLLIKNEQIEIFLDKIGIDLKDQNDFFESIIIDNVSKTYLYRLNKR